ncbi:MAG: DUF4433 domain-containing protein, partial [Bdellovibrionales bacterium]|nr:DUF4433 domain-containing protein [Bdellovibrionales bacterium]
MRRPKQFYYITHKDNLKSGILSRNKTTLWKLLLGKRIKSIHAKDIIEIRKNKEFKNRPLWDYVNLYFAVRNPMLYRVIREFKEDNIVVLQIKSDVIDQAEVGLTDGNAVSKETQFFEDIEKGLSSLDVKQFEKDYWNDSDKRKL